MTKVYIVTDGRYSDYRVIGVYSTKDNAERAKVLYESENEIEKFTLDCFDGDPGNGLLPYAVDMTDSGDVESTERWGAHEMPTYKWCPVTYVKAVRFFVFARDKEHAVKIANERRAELIASEDWTTDYAEWRRTQKTP